MTGVPMVRMATRAGPILPAVARTAFIWPSQVSFTQAEFAQNGRTLPYKRVREKIQGIPIYLRL